MLVPWDVLTVRLPGGVLMGTRNLIWVSDQLANEAEGITTEPIRTELLPREEPKLLPLTVTIRTRPVPFCGETLLIRGEVFAETLITGSTSLPYPLSLSLPRGPMSTVAATSAFHNCPARIRWIGRLDQGRRASDMGRSGGRFQNNRPIHKKPSIRQ